MEAEGQPPRLLMGWLGRVVVYPDHNVGSGQFATLEGAPRRKSAGSQEEGLY